MPVPVGFQAFHPALRVCHGEYRHSPGIRYVSYHKPLCDNELHYHYKKLIFVKLWSERREYFFIPPYTFNELKE